MICGIFAILCIIPALYARLIKKQGNRLDFSILFIAILVPVNWYTPAVFHVTDCNQYTKDILLFPNSTYSLGRHNYIINDSNSDLLLEYIVYGNVKPEKVKDDTIIEPKETYQAPFIHLDYVFEQAPESINTKGDGMVKTKLSCFSSSFDMEE